MSFQILVVDDTKFMRKMLTDILKQYGHEVVGEAENGRQAVQKYEELQPDIVLMDITMPEMDGIEAMKEIRLLNPTAVVLICSAMSQQDLISDALKAGANGYVMKPFKPNRVNEIVRKYGVPRVIGQMIPQEMQRQEVAPAELEVVHTMMDNDVPEDQVAVAMEVSQKPVSTNSVDQAYSERSELLPTEMDNEVLKQIDAHQASPHEMSSKLVYEETKEPEVAELRSSSMEPIMKAPYLEEKKPAKPSQVVNALEVLLAFAEVAETKESSMDVESLDNTEPELSAMTSDVDRTLEMERLAAVMQGDVEPEWELMQQENVSTEMYDAVEAVEVVEPVEAVETVETVEEVEFIEEVEAIDLVDAQEFVEPIEVVQAVEVTEVTELEIPESELSLDDLNEMTLTMENEVQASASIAVPSIPAPSEQVSTSATNKSQESTEMFTGGLKAVNGGKIINLFRGNGPMKNFTSSVMCNWSEEMNGEMSQYLVVCTEAENKIEIEVATAGGQKQSITVTIESFNQLAAWLQVQLGTAPVSNREYAKKADF